MGKDENGTTATAAQALTLVKNGDPISVMFSPLIPIPHSWPRSDVTDMIQSSQSIYVTPSVMQALGWGLKVWHPGQQRWVWVATQ